MADSDSKPYGVIYLISNTRNKKLYIGQTVQSLGTRWSSHCRIDSRCKALSAAIGKYGKESFSISEIGRAETKEELNALEQFYVEKLQTMAPNGYNIKEGGGSKGKWPEEFKKSMSSAVKLGQSKPGVRERMGLAQKNNWADPAIRAARLLAYKNASASAEAREIKSVAMTAVWSRPEFRAARIAAINDPKNKKPMSEEQKLKLREANIGKTFSEETRAKMSAARLGKKYGPMSDEQKKKLSDARIGMTFSDEHRANLSAARRRYVKLQKEA